MARAVTLLAVVALEACLAARPVLLGYPTGAESLSPAALAALRPLSALGGDGAALDRQLRSGTTPTWSSLDSGAGGFCEPGSACWPSPAQWAAFNASVGGALLVIQPEGAACDIPTSPGCAALQANWTNPGWRAAQPGAMQAPNWEADAATGASCYVFGQPCAQGDVPPVGVAATSPSQVAAALRFGAAHNIRVVVKATGHEFQGRSTAAGALLVWLRGLRQLDINTAFAACPGDAPAAAITTGPGTSWGEAYEAVAPLGWAVVGGSARTVSSAGGWLLGGGHSFMSPSSGLGVDNVLQMSVVLANGSQVTASRCSHPDLFWALRGGGGPAFGVVTAATYRLHAVPPAGVTGFSLQVALLRGVQSVDIMLNGLLAFSPSLLDPAASSGGVWGGYWGVSPVNASLFVFSASLVFNGTADAAQASLAGMAAFVSAYPQDLYVLSNSLAPYPSMDDWHNTIDSAETGDRTGVPVTLGSRLVPAAVCADETLRANASLALAIVASYVPLNGMMVTGGAVATADPFGNETSVTPVWRASVQHVAFGIGWALNASKAEVDQAFTGVTQLAAVLRGAFDAVPAGPGGGAYFSESDFLEPDWQRVFWGEQNYARLQAVKAAYDPAGLFTCWHCVELPASGAPTA